MKSEIIQVKGNIVKRSSFLIILLTALLTSCANYDLGNNNLQQTTGGHNNSQTSESQCLDPQIPFAYPSGDASDLPAPSEPIPVLPPDPWRLVSSIPDLGAGNPYQEANSFVIRTNDDHIELWVVEQGHSGIYILNVKTLEWKHIEENNDFLENAYLFMDKNSSIWAAKSGGEGTTLLQYFDDQAGRFITAVDDNNLISKNVRNLAITNIKLDSRGIFWLIVVNNDLTIDPHLFLLYSYNPFTASTEKHEIGIEFDYALAIGENDYIYLMDGKESTVVRYDPLKKKVTNYKILSNIDSGYNYPLYFDSKNHLWVGNLGWFDFADKSYPRWYEIVRPSLFLTYIDSAGLWRWGDPIFTAETTAGVLWFLSANGTGWVNPSTGKWCIFSTYISEVIQDSDNNLWIFVNNSFYQRNSEE